jgi:hypothetical protein
MSARRCGACGDSQGYRLGSLIPSLLVKPVERPFAFVRLISPIGSWFSARSEDIAATVPARWLLPRPDMGRRPARSGGSLRGSISCGLPFLA